MTSKKTLYIIDDDPDIQRLLEHQLSNQFDIHAFVNGTSGIAAVRQKKPDALLVDAALPDIKGDKVIQTIRSQPGTATLPIVVISAFLRKDRSPDELLRRWGVDAFVPKPIDIDKLRAVLQELTGEMILLLESDGMSASNAADLRLEYFDSLDEKLKASGAALRSFKISGRLSDLGAIQRIAHQIMGSAGSYGYLQVSDAAAKLERFCSSSVQSSAPLAPVEVSRAIFLFENLERAARNAREENAVEEKSASEVVPAPTALGTVVLVDDDRFAFERLKQVLAPAGYAVEWIDDPASARAKIQGASPVLIMIDYEMPGIKGPDLCQSLRSDPALSTIPIVVFSAHHEDEFRMAALKTGAVDLISKTCRPEELRMKVDNLARLRHALRKEGSPTVPGMGTPKA